MLLLSRTRCCCGVVVGRALSWIVSLIRDLILVCARFTREGENRMGISVLQIIIIKSRWRRVRKFKRTRKLYWLAWRTHSSRHLCGEEIIEIEMKVLCVQWNTTQDFNWSWRAFTNIAPLFTRLADPQRAPLHPAELIEHTLVTCRLLFGVPTMEKKNLYLINCNGAGSSWWSPSLYNFSIFSH